MTVGKTKKTEKGKYFSWHDNKIFGCRPEISIGLNIKQLCQLNTGQVASGNLSAA